MKRIILFLITNFAIMLVMMVVFHVVCAFLGVDPNAAFAQSGELNLEALAVFSLIFGMTGSIISLLLSKTIAKWSVGAKAIDGTEGEAERWLVETVRNLAERANVKMPEVAIYEGKANAFATGAFRNHALVAVSTDIMAQMTKEELRAVLGHEMSHVANGDMVTMTLLQGVLNACVIFLSGRAERLRDLPLSSGGVPCGKRGVGRQGPPARLERHIHPRLLRDADRAGHRSIARRVLVLAPPRVRGRCRKRQPSRLAVVDDRGPAPARQPRARRPARLDQGDGNRRQARIPLRHPPLARRPHRSPRTTPARHLAKQKTPALAGVFCWWREGDSNPQPADYDSDALPLSYLAGNVE